MIEKLWYKGKVYEMVSKNAKILKIVFKLAIFKSLN